MRRAILRSSRLALGATGCAAAAGVLSINSSKGLAAAEPASAKDLDVDGVGGRVYSALINRKVNACPMAIRVAWHASGTYDAAAETGGSDGATMRFEPEHSDPANSGLFIIHDLLLQVKSALGSALSLAATRKAVGAKQTPRENGCNRAAATPPAHSIGPLKRRRRAHRWSSRRRSSPTATALLSATARRPVESWTRRPSRGPHSSPLLC